MLAANPPHSIDPLVQAPTPPSKPENSIPRSPGIVSLQHYHNPALSPTTYKTTTTGHPTHQHQNAHDPKTISPSEPVVHTHFSTQQYHTEPSSPRIRTTSQPRNSPPPPPPSGPHTPPFWRHSTPCPKSSPCTWRKQYVLYHITLILSCILAPLTVWHINLAYLNPSPSWGPGGMWPERFRDKWDREQFGAGQWGLWGGVYLGIILNALHSLLSLSYYHSLLHPHLLAHPTTSPTPPRPSSPHPLYSLYLKGPLSFLLHTLYDALIMSLAITFSIEALHSLCVSKHLCAWGISNFPTEMRNKYSTSIRTYPGRCEILVWELRTVVGLSVGLWGLLAVTHGLVMGLRAWDLRRGGWKSRGGGGAEKVGEKNQGNGDEMMDNADRIRSPSQAEWKDLWHRKKESNPQRSHQPPPPPQNIAANSQSPRPRAPSSSQSSTPEPNRPIPFPRKPAWVTSSLPGYLTFGSRDEEIKTWPRRANSVVASQNDFTWREVFTGSLVP